MPAGAALADAACPRLPEAIREALLGALKALRAAEVPVAHLEAARALAALPEAPRAHPAAVQEVGA